MKKILFLLLILLSCEKTEVNCYECIRLLIDFPGLEYSDTTKTITIQCLPEHEVLSIMKENTFTKDDLKSTMQCGKLICN